MYQTVCSEMAVLSEKHNHLDKTHALTLKALDISAQERTALRHENALLERLYYMDPGLFKCFL